MPNADRAAVAREVLTKAETVLREDGHDTNADVIAELREEFYPAPPALETVTVDGLTYEKRDDIQAGAWSLQGSSIWPGEALASALSRIASDARVLAELRDENTQLKREVDWITERASSARIAANTFERERDRATADRDAGLRVLAEKEARIAELEQRYSRVVREHEALHDSLEQTEAVLEQRIAERDAALADKKAARHNSQMNHERIAEVVAERDAALRALRERDEKTSAASAPAFGDLGPLDAEMTISVWAKDAASASEPRSAATPIPLGAVVEVAVGDGIRQYTRASMTYDKRIGYGWRCVSMYHWDGSTEGDLVTALYHAREESSRLRKSLELASDDLFEAKHPVATRETVERVALDAWRDVGKVELRHVRQIVDHTYKAAGFTLEGNS